MAIDVSLTNIVSLQNETTAIAAINANNAAIIAGFLEAVALAGTTPNQMQANFDMNSNRILNLPAPVNPTDVVRLEDLETSIPALTLSVGTTAITGGTNGYLLYDNNGVVGTEPTTAITAVGTLTTGTAGTGFVIGKPTMTLGSDATGDVYYRNSSGVLTRLGIGTTGQAIVVSGGLPTWGTVAASAIAIGTTNITGGTNTYIEYNNSGKLGEYAITGTGNVVMSASPTLTGTITASAATLSGTLTVNGTVAGSTTTGTGSIVLAASPTLSGTITGPDSGTWGSGGINGSIIGASSTAAGSFTTLSASSTVSGTGFTNYLTTFLASPPAIGGTAPAAGAFTTLSSTGALSVGGGNLATYNSTYATWALAGATITGTLAPSATNNLSMGSVAGNALTTASNVILIGTGAGEHITTGSNNICVGNNAGILFTTGTQNLIIGYTAGNALTTSASYNTFVGGYNGVSAASQNIVALSDGQGNLRFDYGATTASTNTITGSLNITGAVTTLGAQQTTRGTLVLSNTAAGAYATTVQSSNSATAAWTLTLPVTAGSANYVLSTDGSGNCSWIASSASGSVTSVSVSTANGVSGSVANPTTTPAITLTLGAITPSSVAATGVISASSTATSVTIASNSLYTLGGLGVTKNINLPYGTSSVGNIFFGSTGGYIYIDQGNNFFAAGAGQYTAYGAGALGNVGFGQYTLNSITSGSYNLGLGQQTGSNILTGNSNVAIGQVAMGNGSGAGSQNQSVAIGASSLSKLVSGNNNTGIGYKSGLSLASGAQNTLIGYNAGSAYTSSESYNTILGAAVGTVGESNTIQLSDGQGNIYLDYGHTTASVWTHSVKIAVPGGTNPVLTTTTSVTTGAGSSAGTLTNAPSVGNPTKWIPFNDNGTTRYFPAW